MFGIESLPTPFKSQPPVLISRYQDSSGSRVSTIALAGTVGVGPSYQIGTNDRWPEEKNYRYFRAYIKFSSGEGWNSVRFERPPLVHLGISAIGEHSQTTAKPRWYLDMQDRTRDSFTFDFRLLVDFHVDGMSANFLAIGEGGF